MFEGILNWFSRRANNAKIVYRNARRTVKHALGRPLSPHMHGKYRWQTSPQEGFLQHGNANMHRLTPEGNPTSFKSVREAAQRAHLMVLVSKPNNNDKMNELKHMLTFCEESLRPEIQGYIEMVQKIVASHETRRKSGGRRRQRNSSYR